MIEFISNDTIPRLIQLLEHPEMYISVPCLRTLGNILTGSDEVAQVAIDEGVLVIFNKMINSPKNCIRKEICWSISNVTAGNPG